MDWTIANKTAALWRAALIILILISVALFWVLLFSTTDAGLATVLLVVPLGGFVLLGFIVWRPGTPKLLGLALGCCYLLASWQMIRHSFEIRVALRWLIVRPYWKENALSQEIDSTAGIKGVVWDGWGGFGSDTDVYIVFDPDDGLRNYSPTDLSGLRCPVWGVQRLERQWYSVTLYTNSGWDGGCGRP